MKLQEAGAITASDMTIEAATAKLSFLLSLNLTFDELKNKFLNDLRGEMTPNNIHSIDIPIIKYQSSFIKSKSPEKILSLDQNNDNSKDNTKEKIKRSIPSSPKRTIFRLKSHAEMTDLNHPPIV